MNQKSEQSMAVNFTDDEITARQKLVSRDNVALAIMADEILAPEQQLEELRELETPPAPETVDLQTALDAAKTVVNYLEGLKK